MGVRWFSYSDPKSAAEACAHHILTLLEEAISGQEFATLAISGGTSPKPLFERLAESQFRWDAVHFFWVDERAVSPTDQESNFRLAEESLLVPAHVPRANIHRIHGELLPDQAAQIYSDEIREFFGLEAGELPHFDIVQQGMGPDAHTASLFPGEALLDDREGIAAAVLVEKLAKWRITLLPGVLLAAKHNVFLVTGADKAEAVRAVFQEDYDPQRYPAQIVAHNGRRMAWFLDKAAAALAD